MVVIIFSDEKNQSIVIILVRKKNILCSASYINNSDSNLVDPASSHTLVSKIKPCMCKYK